MFDSEIIVRLSLSLAIGLIIGIERQWHHKNAGLKTNTLVAVGSTAFALIAQHGFGLNNNPSQIAAGVVTGIGFLGAGVIMRRGGSIQGINTAATLWATTGMGLAVGAGYYALALALLVTVLIIQLPFRLIAEFIDKRSGFISPTECYHLSVTATPEAAPDVRASWAEFTGRKGVLIINASDADGGDTDGAANIVLSSSFQLSEDRITEVATLPQRFRAIAGVSKADCQQTEIKENL
jgi:putative Mg2+ transporter-C (MgtC) family protein